MCAPPHRGPAHFRRWSLAEPERSRPGEPVMNRTTLVALATPVVVNATSLAKADVAAATASVAAPRTEEPVCARRIKVVYAGYGEAKATPCAVVGLDGRN